MTPMNKLLTLAAAAALTSGAQAQGSKHLTDRAAN